MVARCLADVHAQRRMEQAADALACRFILLAVQDGREMDARSAGH